MTKVNGVSFKRNLVPSNKYGIKCPYSMKPKKITIHNTDNSAPAVNEINYMNSNNNQVSFHVAVDENGVIQGLPYNRNGWHAGDGGNGYGNRNTIGVEMARSYDRNRKTTNLNNPLKTQFKKTFDNTIKFVAQLCVDLGIAANSSNIKQHRDWSSKYCPRKILDDKTWNKLLNGIIKEYNRLKGKSTSTNIVKPSKPSKKPKTGRYKGNSIVEYLISKDINHSIPNRRKLAKEYGVSNYDLSAKKNLELLNKMRGSKKTSSSKSTSKSTTKLKVDGYMGPLTIKALQRYFKTTVDGVISKPSMVIRALQRHLNKNGAKLKVDGYFGSLTIRALQKYLGTTQDGVISKPSAVIKELQRRLNAGNL